ncbi:OprD family outer membrane porin [Sulfurimonas sp. HSL-1716]|uniref:OprD family outer membrane porin n=1 Tax=Hydrocurvibacter sulfurireducens TaxID=3131937 RepID=UPI0031F75FED
MNSSKMATISLAAVLLCMSTQLSAQDDAPKQALKTNYQLIYNVKPKQADSFGDMFKKGDFFGRLRSNTFLFNWANNTSKDTLSSGLGGSLVYQSAVYNDFDVRLGLYYSHGFVDNASSSVANLKGGADTLNKYDYNQNGSQDLYALSQAYVRYSGISKSDIIVGRQLVETFFTASNDTKMIPETFDGIVFNSKSIPNTKIRVAYLADEKMRGHSNTNSPLVYKSGSTTDTINDDTAMHKGLTYTNLMAHGKSTAAPLIIAEAHNRSVKNLKLDASGYSVPELVGQGMIEANYKIPFNNDLSITPGFRYLHQFDEGAGKVGGAALTGSLAGHTGDYGGYKKADSLESNMIAARLVTKYKKLQVNLGYSNVFDEADLVNPWRAFPTSGYTRSMARYNWYADSRSYRIQMTLNKNKTGVYKDPYIELSALHTDNDAAKGLYSENYYYAGITQNFPSMPELQWRFRIGYDDVLKTPTTTVDDNLDTRLEFNYLF